MSGVAEVEWDPRSSDFGKARFGNIRVDPWAGFQQPVVLAARLITGKTKQLSTGQLRELDAGEAIWNFITSKFQPSPRIILNRGEGFAGQKPFDPSPIPKVPSIIYDNFVFLFAQDIIDAYAESGPTGAALALPSILGVSTQTFSSGQWVDDFKEYYSLPSNASEAKAKGGMTRLQYRARNPEVDAKLFLSGQVASLQSGRAYMEMVRLMEENNISIEDINGLKEEPFESTEREATRQRLQRLLSVQQEGGSSLLPAQPSPGGLTRQDIADRLRALSQERAVAP